MLQRCCLSIFTGMLIQAGVCVAGRDGGDIPRVAPDDSIMAGAPEVAE